jgi:hypothetical protein
MRVSSRKVMRLSDKLRMVDRAVGVARYSRTRLNLVKGEGKA